MLGEIIFELTAENSAELKFINGRLMHAAFFQILNSASPQLGNFIHEKMNLKPFTVSFLNPKKNLPNFEGQWQVRRGEFCRRFYLFKSAIKFRQEIYFCRCEKFLQKK